MSDSGLALLAQLSLTALFYSFPLWFALFKKTRASFKRYLLIFAGYNAIILILSEIILFSKGFHAFDILPAILWTAIFCLVGWRMLKSKPIKEEVKNEDVAPEGWSIENAFDEEQVSPLQNTPEKKSHFSEKIPIGIIGGCLIIGMCCTYFLIPEPTAAEPQPATSETTAMPEKNTATSSETTKKETTVPMEDGTPEELEAASSAYPITEFVTPGNGEILSEIGLERTVILTVMAEGENDYYVKLVSDDTQKPVMSFYVKAGQAPDIEIPVGSFHLMYTTGTKWDQSTFTFQKNALYYQKYDQIKSDTIVVDLPAKPDGTIYEIDASAFNI